MNLRAPIYCLVGLALALTSGPRLAWADAGKATDPANIEFFEKEVRPLLAEHCLKCHGGGKNKKGEVIAQGELDLTARDRILKGGESGAVVVPGDPDKSLLVQAVRYQLDSPRMPKKGKLSDKEIAVLARWVRLGLPYPESTATNGGAKEAWRITDEQRRWWAFQPVKPVT